MRRLPILFAGLAAWLAAHAAPPLYVSPDVPTSETASGATILPWQVARHDGSVPGYSLAFSVPGDPEIDAIHKLDAPGAWLLSVEAPSDLGGSLSVPAEPRDVIRCDAGGCSLFFCGGSVAGAVPPQSRLDAVYLEGGDTGSLVVSFDVPTTIGPSIFEPADLVRYNPTVGSRCADWELSVSNPAFDASAAGFGVASSSNVIGADKRTGPLILAFDVPTDLGPPGPRTFLPGQLVAWDGLTFTPFESLTGWPPTSFVEGVSGLANPGQVPATITLDKSTTTPGDLTIRWSPSCADGAEDYGIYEGTIGIWYGHAPADCEDAGGDLTEEVTPAAGSHYYLVVARSAIAEGSYGIDSSGDERPVGVAVCAAAQVVTPCPP